LGVQEFAARSVPDIFAKVFAVPLRQITQPKNGYVSEFASGMIPLSSLKLGTENTYD
jgi:hypothetical protein